ncbi:hypothetical protein [Agromyces marinus]|uniref:hypothetical protein n=1 Tax=Agromyces marinus TaxID=1389020 RepID=UPI002573901D|nr:hypothetical protein [Agromyces marinus]
MRAAAIADAVAERGEQVHRIAHHPPRVVAARAHGRLEQAVVDVDVARHHVVVRERDRIGPRGEEALRTPRADRAEPDDVARACEVQAEPRAVRLNERAAGVCGREAFDVNACRAELLLERVCDTGDAAARLDGRSDLDDPRHPLACSAAEESVLRSACTCSTSARYRRATSRHP